MSAKRRLIELACELPTEYLSEFSPLTDFDFALAHEVLASPACAAFHETRKRGRTLILDNSFHELGRPLPIEELIQAARLVRADFVVAPDLLEDPLWTREQYRLCAPTLRASGFPVAAVLCGDTSSELRRSYTLMQDAEMLCLPFRRPRFAWYEELQIRHPRVHLLGMTTLDELRAWKAVAAATPETHFSVDTAKPVKAGIVLRRIADGESLRGIPVSSAALLRVARLGMAQLELIVDNVQVLRDLLSA